MKQIDNRQKIMTKSRAERTVLGKHDPRIVKKGKANLDYHEHSKDETPSAAGGDKPAQLPDNDKKTESNQPPGPKVGRNDPCPCSSGKKYKKCCLNKII